MTLAMTFTEFMREWNQTVSPVLWGVTFVTICIGAYMAVGSERMRRALSTLCKRCQARKDSGAWWIGSSCEECNKAFVEKAKDDNIKIAALIRQNMILGRIVNRPPPSGNVEARWFEALGTHAKTWEICDDGKSIKCLACNMTSFSIEDVRNKYCGNCRRFHEEIPGRAK